MCDKVGDFGGRTDVRNCADHAWAVGASCREEREACRQRNSSGLRGLRANRRAHPERVVTRQSGVGCVEVQRRAIHIPERGSGAVKDLSGVIHPPSASRRDGKKMLSRGGEPTHDGTEPETTDLFPIAPALPAVVERQKLFGLLVDLGFLEPTLTARESSRHAGESWCDKGNVSKGSSTPGRVSRA